MVVWIEWVRAGGIANLAFKLAVASVGKRREENKKTENAGNAEIEFADCGW